MGTEGLSTFHTETQNHREFKLQQTVVVLGGWSQVSVAPVPVLFCDSFFCPSFYCRPLSTLLSLVADRSGSATQSLPVLLVSEFEFL